MGDCKRGFSSTLVNAQSKKTSIRDILVFFIAPITLGSIGALLGFHTELTIPLLAVSLVSFASYFYCVSTYRQLEENDELYYSHDIILVEQTTHNTLYLTLVSVISMFLSSIPFLGLILAVHCLLTLFMVFKRLESIFRLTKR